MRNTEEELSKYSLNPDNSVVIGSEILEELGMRDSNDIDVVVEEKKLNDIIQEFDFDTVDDPTSGRLFTDGKIEISDMLYIRHDDQQIQISYEELVENSCIINRVRYITPEFLLEVKKEWNRDKDRKDIEFLEEFLEGNK